MKWQQRFGSRCCQQKGASEWIGFRTGELRGNAEFVLNEVSLSPAAGIVLRRRELAESRGWDAELEIRLGMAGEPFGKSHVPEQREATRERRPVALRELDACFERVTAAEPAHVVLEAVRQVPLEGTRVGKPGDSGQPETGPGDRRDAADLRNVGSQRLIRLVVRPYAAAAAYARSRDRQDTGMAAQ